MINKNDPIALVPSDLIPKAIDTPTDELMSLFRLVNKMEKLCHDEKGVGLSAVQVGIPWNLFIINKGRSYDYYINCRYEGVGQKFKSIEGCLSLKNQDGSFRRFEVQRFDKIKLTGKQLVISGNAGLAINDIDFVVTGIQAVIIQHETDHGFGILISDIGREIEIIP
jgi:peptide deformylase